MAIKLEKSGDTHRINLEKSPKTITEEIIVNLDWSKGGFFKQLFGGAIDLSNSLMEEEEPKTKLHAKAVIPKNLLFGIRETIVEVAHLQVKPS